MKAARTRPSAEVPARVAEWADRHRQTVRLLDAVEAGPRRDLVELLEAINAPPGRPSAFGMADDDGMVKVHWKVFDALARMAAREYAAIQRTPRIDRTIARALRDFIVDRALPAGCRDAADVKLLPDFPWDWMPKSTIRKALAEALQQPLRRAPRRRTST